MIDLRPDHLEIVRDLLRQYVPGCEVRAFGSRFKWTAKQASDLDLAVVGTNRLPAKMIARLKEAFAESILPMRVDVLDWHAITSEFQQVIEEGFEVIQGGEVSPLASASSPSAAGSSATPLCEEILGPIPSDWEYVQLGEVCRRNGGEIQTGPFGSQLHAADYVLKGIPSIMPQNIGDNRIDTDGIARITNADAKRLSRYLVRSGDIVYSRRGDVEKRALIRQNEDGWLCGTGCLRIRFGNKKSVIPEYASFYLGHPSVRSWIVRHAQGATMPNLNTSILSSCPFVLPPENIQRALVSILGTLDDRIELCRQMNETLVSMARALFKDWFIDFGPVRAKMEGRELVGISSEVAGVFPDTLVDSEIGEIPDGWLLSDLTEIAELNPESWSKKSAPYSIYYADLSNVKYGVIETVEEHLWSDAPSRAQRILRPGDTIVGIVRPGNGSYALVGVEGITGSTGFAVLRPKSNYLREMVYLAATRAENIDHLSHLADGGAYPAVRPDVVAATQIVLPNTNRIIEAFSSALSPSINSYQRNHELIQTLTFLRDNLLPKLLSGVLSIPEAMLQVEISG
jgi:type I restriction enzyme S subunit